MSQRLPQPKLPAPGEIVSPITSIENALLSAVRAPFQMFGLPVPPSISGPIGIIGQLAAQLPAPPQPPALPSIPNLPKLPGG